MGSFAQIEADTPCLAGFSERFLTTLRPQLARIDRRRKKGAVYRVLGFVLALTVGVLVVRQPHPIDFAWCVLALLAYVSGVIEVAAARKDATRLILHELYAFVGVHYVSPSPGVDIQPFVALGMFADVKRVVVDGEIRGALGKPNLGLFETVIKISRRKYYPNMASFSWFKFDGFLGGIDVRTSSPSSFSALTGQWEFIRLPRIVGPGEEILTGDKALDQHYHVFAEHESQTQKFLTPEVRSCLVNIIETVDGAFDFGVADGKLLFALNRQDYYCNTRGMFASLASENFTLAVLRDAVLINRLCDVVSGEASGEA